MARCTAITASGKRCSRSALPGRKSCKQHIGTRRRHRKPRVRGGEFEQEVKLSHIASFIAYKVHTVFDGLVGHYMNHHPLSADDVLRAAKELEREGKLRWAPEMDRTLSADDIDKILVRTFVNFYRTMEQIGNRTRGDVPNERLQLAKLNGRLQRQFKAEAHKLFAETPKTPAFRQQGPRNFEFFSTARTTVQNPDGSFEYDLAAAPTADQGDLLSRLASGSAQTHNQRGSKRGIQSAENQQMSKRSALSVLSSSDDNF